MQKFKQIREAAKYNPYAIGMAAAKKKAGITAGHAKDLPKSVIVKGHEIAKKIKANEEFDTELDALAEELEFLSLIEQFTEEELTAFMASEDFNQLDEISRSTLVSYVKKSVNDMEARKDAAKSFNDRADDMRKVSHEIGTSIGKGAAKDEVDAKRREYEDKAAKHQYKSWKRGANVVKALDRLAK